MPKAVASFLSSKTFEGILEIQRGILNDYRDDVRKYAEGLDQTRILNVFDNIAPQLALPARIGDSKTLVRRPVEHQGARWHGRAPRNDQKPSCGGGCQNETMSILRLRMSACVCIASHAACNVGLARKEGFAITAKVKSVNRGGL